MSKPADYLPLIPAVQWLVGLFFPKRTPEERELRRKYKLEKRRLKLERKRLKKK